MRIADVLLADGHAAFTNDDQAAIRSGAERDGFLYRGAPATPGFRRVRQPGEALSIMLALDDGAVVHGDGASVQYAGAAGRDGLLVARDARRDHGPAIRRELVGSDVTSFRESSGRLAALGLPNAVAYGVSQALLAAAAHAGRRTIAETVAIEYDTGAPLRQIPLFAQCGEDRRTGVDRMVLLEVDELPHGLINNAHTLVGSQGEHLLEYVHWVRDRVLACRLDDDYQPVLHFDTYGTIEQVFPSVKACAAYLAQLGEAATPLALRIEHPVHASTRAQQIRSLARLRGQLRTHGSDVEIVADEWCNTLEDVIAFVEADAADMVHVKVPDLGTLDAAINALHVCKLAGVRAYCGGSGTETERTAQICAGVAMGTDADLLLARPGMGVHEAVMVVRNEMSRTLARVEAGV